MNEIVLLTVCRERQGLHRSRLWTDLGCKDLYCLVSLVVQLVVESVMGAPPVQRREGEREGDGM